MPVKVFTQSECDRCGSVETAEGAHGDRPPKGWAIVAFSLVGSGPGMSDSKRVVVVLCSKCQLLAQEHIAPLSGNGVAKREEQPSAEITGIS